MGYRNLRSCLTDLEQHGGLRRIDAALDPNLEIPTLQRWVYQAGGPALLFTRPQGCAVPLVGNLFGTLERTRFLFRDALRRVEGLVQAKIAPQELLRHPRRYKGAPVAAAHLLPKRRRHGPILAQQARLSELPQVVGWPRDGGPFITLPQVYSEDPRRPGWRGSNLGMYRVQLVGNAYEPEQEVGLHYQIHRGLGVHHARAAALGQSLPVNVFVGGPPSLTVAAVMPLPEGLPELAFAGVLGGRRLALVTSPDNGLPMPAEADFVLSGYLEPHTTKPEGPFGDHLGYYSEVHDFPVLRLSRIWRRRDAVWPFTSVGRPPQEDTSFGAFIHEVTGELIPTVLPGVVAVHAVDAAGVHPLLLAQGQERYTPYRELNQPQEILTQACAVLGQGQLSLAKFLFIVAREDNPQLDVHDCAAFLNHFLQRVDWRRDVHFLTATTQDTLDYSAPQLNRGSKAIWAAAGPPLRSLAHEGPADLHLPAPFGGLRVAAPGVLVLQGPAEDGCWEQPGRDLAPLLAQLEQQQALLTGWPLLVVVDDSEFAARHLDNFLWVSFTRADPCRDVHGVAAFWQHHHWGCHSSLVLDARLKPWQAPPLEEDPQVCQRLQELAAPGGPLHGLF